jgi:tellurite resistance protein
MTQSSVALTIGAQPAVSARRPFSPVGFAHFSVPLGLCGLAGAWTAASDTIGAPTWVEDILWTVAALIWVVLIALYAVRRLRGPERVSSDLRHPVSGPFAANIPVIGVLLTTHFGRFVPVAAPWIVGALVVLSLLVAARLLTRWLTSEFDAELLHPGYFLPVVAAAFVGSIGFSSAHLPGAAMAAFGAGIFFWLVIGTVVTGRLITGSALPNALTPTLVVLVVPPGVGGVAWLSIVGGVRDPVGYALLGILIVLAAVQLMLLPVYLRLPATLSAWTFTFPLGSATNFTIRWLHADPGTPATVAGWALIAVATASVAAIALGVLVHGLMSRRDPLI